MDIIIKESEIEGKGVFANREFKKGEAVIKWDVSHVLTKEEINNSPETEKRYVVHIKSKSILMQPPARYVNHSCDANTHAKDNSDIANRIINKGEEITADYSETMGTNESMKCNCKSKNCRGIIRGNGQPM